MAKRGDFTDILIRKGIITAQQVEEARKTSRTANISVGDALIKLGHCSGDDVAQAQAQEHGLEYVDLNETKIPPAVIELLSESVARENTVLPLSMEADGSLKVIVVDPFDLDVQDKLRFILNRKIDIALASREGITAAINRCYGAGAAGAVEDFAEGAIDFAETGSGEEELDESSAPIIRLVQMIITDAVKSRASDIHIEPFEDRVRVRFRVDGVLVERDAAARRLLGPMLSRIKILAKIDIAERRRPQDGRIKVSVGEKELDLRVSVLPTSHGQSIVMRLLDKDNIKIGLKQLGMADEDLKAFQNLVRRPNGIILVTGPTGSGKTTTLYAALNDLNRPDRKIITAEDPVEYYLPGINQVEVRHSIGLDFARIIRAMLRQAPNIILVGEMRDSETAEMGIQASLTGHLVFSTLHTNDAPGAVTRMVDMGVPAYLVASSVIAILAQRLVRTVCPKCKQPHRPTDSVLDAAGIRRELADKATFMKGKGCSNCNKTGYRGRLGIYELMMMSSRIRELSFQGVSTQDLRKAAVAQGMRTLYQDGIYKALRGITTIEEVFRVAKRADDE
ncbi:MAG TPA: GspE/PulE family protein [Pirellulales bacterium]|jgi:type IV pilus assembly protein PilB|nr:GspE/PulE family protein [Pirellulales bacterium]